MPTALLLGLACFAIAAADVVTRDRSEPVREIPLTPCRIETGDGSLTVEPQSVRIAVAKNHRAQVVFPEFDVTPDTIYCILLRASRQPWCQIMWTVQETDAGQTRANIALPWPENRPLSPIMETWTTWFATGRSTAQARLAIEVAGSGGHTNAESGVAIANMTVQALGPVRYEAQDSVNFVRHGTFDNENDKNNPFNDGVRPITHPESVQWDSTGGRTGGALHVAGNTASLTAGNYPARSGYCYRFSAWYRGNGKLSLDLRYPYNISACGKIAPSIDTNVWQQIEIHIVMPPNQTSLRTQLDLAPEQDGLWLDDVELREVGRSSQNRK